MAVARLSDGEDVTLPSDIGRRAGLKAGDRVELVVRDDGTVLIVPRTVRAADLYGILPKPKKTVTLEEMEESIIRGATS